MSNLSKPLIVCIFQTKFSEFNWNLLELDNYHTKCSVLVLDLSLLLSKQFSRLLNHSSNERKEFITPNSWMAVIEILSCIRRKAKDRKVLVIYGVVPFSLKSLAFNLIFTYFIKSKCGAVIKLWNGGILIPSFDIRASSYERIKKRIIINSSFKESITHLIAKFFSVITHKLPPAFTHILVSGSDWEKVLMDNFSQKVLKSCKIIRGHSWDYSNLLHSQESNYQQDEICGGKGAIYIDTGSPMFKGDSFFSNRKVFYSVENWYPSLHKFMSAIELARRVKVTIASHYKANHTKNPDYFGFRDVISSGTMRLIQKSDLVIAVNSTAISFAVVMKKPILLIYSNELCHDIETMTSIKEISNTLQVKVVNIDDFVQEELVTDQVSEDAYRDYMMRCLTSIPDSKLSNSSLLMNEFFNEIKS